MGLAFCRGIEDSQKCNFSVNASLSPSLSPLLLRRARLSELLVNRDGPRTGERAKAANLGGPCYMHFELPFVLEIFAMVGV